MYIITRNRPQVKLALHSAHTLRPFGQGILASRPSTRLDCTIADLAEMAQVFGEISDARDAALDRDYDARAWEAAATDRLSRGHCL